MDKSVNSDFKSYKLKITALTPIHIGNGEVYEPTNYVVDDGYLYEFDEILFLKILPNNLKNEFIKLTQLPSEDGYELFEKIHAFIVKHKEYAKKVSHHRVRVSKKFEDKYKKDIANKVQIEGNSKHKKNNNQRSVFNKFEVLKTQRLTNRVTPYIPGSSIKGAISTAYQEKLFKNYGEEKWDEFKKEKVFKNLLISDTIAQKTDAQIGFAVNKELFEKSNSNVYTMIEVNSTHSTYLATLNIKNYKKDNSKEEIKEKITKEKIINSCNAHYKKLYEEYNGKIKLNENQFLLSLGKYSGARAVTIDGLRKISVKLCEIKNKRGEENDFRKRISRLYKKSQNETKRILELFTDEKLLNDKEKEEQETAKDFLTEPSKIENLVENNNKIIINAYLTQETTIWKFSEDFKNSKKFGWVLCEFIEDEEYDRLLKEFRDYEKRLIEENQKSRDEILSKIKKEKELEIEKAKKLELEKKEKAKKEAQEREKIKSMSLCERVLYNQIKQNPGVPKYTLILNGIKNGMYDDFKCEALRLAKKYMQESGRWKTETKAKKPQKDKNYQRTLQILEMLKECK